MREHYVTTTPPEFEFAKTIAILFLLAGFVLILAMMYFDVLYKSQGVL